MPEESLVARLRAHVEGDDGSWHWEDTDALLREAADALERAEKERGLLRGILANVPDDLVLSSPGAADRVAMFHETSLSMVEPDAAWLERTKHNLMTMLLRARATYRALSPSTKDETK